MKYRNITILFLSIFTTLNSYGQTAIHADHLLYYSTIALQLKDITPKVQTFWGEMNQTVITATDNGNHKLDGSAISKLKDDLRNNENELDRKIRMIGSLDETDPELNLKQTVIDYLTEAKSFEEAAVPKVIQYLEKGLDKMTEQEKQILKLFIVKGEQLHKRSRMIENLSGNYRAKHNITNLELEKYGL